ncbi:MAG TPA: hypothetical protein VGL06_24200 [Pseudonocardiaceae bacterium]
MTMTMSGICPDWTVLHSARIVDAAGRAPRWGVHQPWVVELRGRTVSLYEHIHGSLHHSAGTERLFACGAALTNIRLAVRTAGWRADTRFVTDPDQPDLVSAVTAEELLPPTLAEAHRFAAIFGAAERSAPARPLSPPSLRAIASASWCTGVELRLLDTQSAGAVRYIAGNAGAMFLVLTTDDGRLDRVRAGAAVQSACLTGRAVGLVMRPVVEPLWRPGVRAGLIERLSLAGYPQALLRVDSTIPTN